MTNLTLEVAKELFEYDQHTGKIHWRVGPNAGAEAGTVAKGYRQLWVKGKFYGAHRVAWLLQTGTLPTDQIDHINGTRDDNRWCNLREATHEQNQHNRSSNGGLSGVKGVSWFKSRALWRLRLAGHTWYFKTLEEAEKNAIILRNKYHGEFANHK